ncbi:dihydropteroate synthase [Corynebacterium heidelbergense]|nr:dihydropteroate synthase [Corynebacterium heidelbergense]WCZ35872.1 Dihydropteroate synthase 1 [Corynebacterium heidelbergense]
MTSPAPRTLVMGICNVTPDSFSDGGDHAEAPAAIAAARRMIADGADIIDIGGESTRPGAKPVDPAEEMGRVLPVIRELAAADLGGGTGQRPQISIDTMHARTAEAALSAGADIVNDVSGGLADPDLLRVCAQAAVPVCLMHWGKQQWSDQLRSKQQWSEEHLGKGQPRGEGHADEIVAEVRDGLLRRVDAALGVGVQKKNIILDPGIGFAKSAADNWALLAALDELVALGFPLLLGASRKRFLTALRPGPDGNPGTPQSADSATAATSALAAAAGVWAVRVHNVAPSRAAVDVAHCIATGSGPEVPEGWRARRG